MSRTSACYHADLIIPFNVSFHITNSNDMEFVPLKNEMKMAMRPQRHFEFWETLVWLLHHQCTQVHTQYICTPRQTMVHPFKFPNLLPRPAQKNEILNKQHHRAKKEEEEEEEGQPNKWNALSSIHRSSSFSFTKFGGLLRRYKTVFAMRWLRINLISFLISTCWYLSSFTFTHVFTTLGFERST